EFSFHLDHVSPHNGGDRKARQLSRSGGHSHWRASIAPIIRCCVSRGRSNEYKAMGVITSGANECLIIFDLSSIVAWLSFAFFVCLILSFIAYSTLHFSWLLLAYPDHDCWRQLVHFHMALNRSPLT